MYWKSDPMFVCRLEDKDLPALGDTSEKVRGRAPLPGVRGVPGGASRPPVVPSLPARVPRPPLGGRAPAPATTHLTGLRRGPAGARGRADWAGRGSPRRFPLLLREAGGGPRS